MRPINVTHRPVEAKAIQVVPPYSDVTSFVPRSRKVDHPSGRLSHFHLVDAVGKTAAYDNEWILKFSNGAVQILTDAEFTNAYE